METAQTAWVRLVCLETERSDSTKNSSFMGLLKPSIAMTGISLGVIARLAAGIGLHKHIAIHMVKPGGLPGKR